eukprot:1589241-Pleurochrysis_carterae.AAC.2
MQKRAYRNCRYSYTSCKGSLLEKSPLKPEGPPLEMIVLACAALLQMKSNFSELQLCSKGAARATDQEFGKLSKLTPAHGPFQLPAWTGSKQIFT